MSQRKVTTNSDEESAARILRLGTAAKAPGRDVLIFTIGFELDRVDAGDTRDRAYRIMRECATSPDAHFFGVESIREEGAIGEAFKVIAPQIEQ